MKKAIAVILALTLALCAGLSLAESEEKLPLGTLSINGVFTLQCGMPDGYAVEHTTDSPGQVIAMFRSEDPEAPLMVLSVAFDETYWDVDRMNDLDADALSILEQTFIDNDPDVEITYGETGLGTLLMIARHHDEDLDFISFLSIYKGYFVEFILVPSDTATVKTLTDEQMAISIDFLTDLDFIPGVRPMGVSQEALAGQTFVTNLSGYNAGDNTVRAEVLRHVVLDPASVADLQPGDELVYGKTRVEVETVEKDEEFGETVVNEYIYLRNREDGVHVFEYESEYMEAYTDLLLNLPDTVVFLDDIDPETGDMLDEPTEHNAAELIEMLQANTYPNFSSQNVNVTFDEAGEISLVERFYTPWQ